MKNSPHRTVNTYAAAVEDVLYEDTKQVKPGGFADNGMSSSQLTVIHNELNSTEAKLLDKILQRLDNHFNSGSTARVYKFSRDKIVRIQATDWTDSKMLSTARARKAMLKTLSWQKACIGTNSEHVPKIFFIGYKAKKTETNIKMLVTVMEKLKEVPARVDFHYNFLNDLEVVMNTGKELHPWSGNFLRANPKFGTSDSFHQLGKYLASRREYKYNDVHSANLMIRPPEGRLVITDPIA